MVEAIATNPEQGFSHELRIVVRFGGPIAASQLVQYLIVLTDIVMIARFGGLSLAAGLLINSVYTVIYVTSFGLLQGMLPLASRAATTGDAATFSDAIRAGLRIGLGVGLVLAVAVAAIVLCLEPLGYSPAFAKESIGYTFFILPGYFLSILLIGLRNILISVGHTRHFALIMILSALLNAGLNYVFGFGALGFPAMGLAGIGLATSLVDAALFTVFGLLALKAMRGHSAHTLRWPAEAFRAILRIGVPTASIFFVETTMFSGMLFIVGRSDTDFLAALGLIFQYATMAMMVPIGLSQAAVQRASVAAATAATAPAMLGTVTSASLTIVGVYLAALAAVQFGLHVNFPQLLIIGTTLDEAILSSLYSSQIYVFAIIIFHALIIVIASILRGIENVRSSLWIVLACYWGAGLGLGFTVIDLAGYGAEHSIGIVALAMLLSLLSILLKLNASLRQWRTIHGSAKHG